jgi:hypothetical protein
MVLVIALFWCWSCLLAAGGNLLPHIVTPLDITTVVWCFRQTQVVIHCRKPLKCTAKFPVTVDSKCLHYLTLHRKFLQSVCWRLVSCPAEGCVEGHSLITGFQTVFRQNFGVTQTAPSFLQLKWRKNVEYLSAFFIQSDTARVYTTTKWFVRGIRGYLTEIW